MWSCGAVVVNTRIIPVVLTGEDAASLLEPFGLNLSPPQQEQLLSYLRLLLHWNRSINLSGVRDAEGCVTRHFGESLYLTHALELGGRLLDIGSGAGFPGLALKILCPKLSVTLLEPSTRKRVFLREVARLCAFEGVELRAERLAEFVKKCALLPFDLATARAVGSLDRLVRDVVRCLRPGGRICLWVSAAQVKSLAGRCAGICWGKPMRLPLSREREIWIGTLTGGEAGLKCST